MHRFYEAPAHRQQRDVSGIAIQSVMCWNPARDSNLDPFALAHIYLRNPMKKILSILALGLSLSFGAAHAADAAADCAAKSAEKKLAGAAKSSFEKKCVKDAGGGAPMAASPACEKSAADKKLAGAAKTSHMKKCMADEKGEAKPMAKPMAKAAEPAKK